MISIYLGIIKLMNKQDLIDFEKSIAEEYETGSIYAPIHLRDGNEDKLIDIFRYITPNDYVFSTWASHLHALLKGVPPELVKSAIRDGNSITLHFPTHRFYTSAIVGGICPIATGVAWGLKQRDSRGKVYCFIGDMAVQSGIASESIRYSIAWDLPIIWVIEDNGVSVGTPTKETWGIESSKAMLGLSQSYKEEEVSNCQIWYYTYKSSYPHAGTGTFVEF